jgi:hypothetical protein
MSARIKLFLNNDRVRWIPARVVRQLQKQKAVTVESSTPLVLKLKPEFVAEFMERFAAAIDLVQWSPRSGSTELGFAAMQGNLLQRIPR